MAQDISAIGIKFFLKASITFPIGFEITEFPSDQDPLDASQVAIGEYSMGVNGDMIMIRKAQGLEISFSLIPGTEADLAMQIIANANRVAKNKQSHSDVLTLSVMYPDGTVKVLTNGILLEAPFLTSVSSGGGFKMNTYRMAFEGMVI